MDFEAGFLLTGQAIAAFLLGAFLWWRLKAYLLFFQQEEYDRQRFRRWLNAAGARDRAASLLIALGAWIGFAAAFGFAWSAYVLLALLILGLLEGLRRSRRPLRGAKKPLVMTARAWRLHLAATALGLLLAFALWAAAASAGGAELALALSALVTAQAAPYLLIVADRLLAPIEGRVKRRYRQEAEQKLARLDPFVIGITGSYGKTTTKHILAHILSSAAPTLATPGSVNTEMGITRVIRDSLAPHHRYFIVEMGAYGPGSIARLCRFTPPKLGIITAVGWAHYERFKTIDAVFDAKFEMADAVAENGGRTVVNADGVPQERLDSRLKETSRDLILAGQNPEAAFRLRSIRQTPEGIALKLREKGGSDVAFTVPIYGAHQAANILAAVAAARELGMPMEQIKAALASCPQVRHRLEVYRSGKIMVIDDAYNANPIGFVSALEVLEVLKKAEGGRGVLITPGMVELGDKHDEEHAWLGEAAARAVDIALVVTPGRIDSFVSAFERAADSGTALFRFDRQAEAEAWLKANAQPGDVVVFENNLPDLYESRPAF